MAAKFEYLFRIRKNKNTMIHKTKIQQKYDVIKSGHKQTDAYVAYNDDLVSSLFWQNTNGYG